MNFNSIFYFDVDFKCNLGNLYTKKGDPIMETPNVKEKARRLIEALSDDATWDDLMYQIYVHQSIEAGLEDSKAGRIIEVKDVRVKFGLDK